MSLYLLDTDHLSLYQVGHPQVVKNILLHLRDRLAIGVISIEEQLSGWQRALHQARDDARRAKVYRRMALTVESWSGWLILPFSVTAMGRPAALLRQRLNVGSNDLKIAAIAQETNATVVTRHHRDFSRVPALTIEDWSP
jgi:tRNA(fMet)-specific endonuclease VapC